MKKILNVLLVCILMFAAGCGDNSSDSQKDSERKENTIQTAKESEPDSMAIYVGEEKLVSLAMSKKEIEAIVAEDAAMNELMEVDETKEEYYKVYENNSFMIRYENDKPVAILLNEEGKKYTDFLGIKPQSNINDLVLAFSEHGLKSGYMGTLDDGTFVANFNKNGELINSLEMSDNDKNAIDHSIMYVFDENSSGVIKSVYINKIS